MMWQEDDTDNNEAMRASDAVVDMAFRIDCAQLPVDHAWALYRALARALPWLASEPRAAVHRIFGAASGNGWSRPAAVAGEALQLSKRTRLTLRLPKQRIDDAMALNGQTLDIGGAPLTIGDSRVKRLCASPTLFARSVAGAGGDESAFSRALSARLAALDIRPAKLLCGLAHSIATDGAALGARSVLLADLRADESLRLQQCGLGGADKLGAELKLGCGIFVPHKSIAAVGKHN